MYYEIGFYTGYDGSTEIMYTVRCVVRETLKLLLEGNSGDSSEEQDNYNVF
jgi:hypothetical protein